MIIYIYDIFYVSLRLVETNGDSDIMQTFCGEPSGLLKETDAGAQRRSASGATGGAR